MYGYKDIGCSYELPAIFKIELYAVGCALPLLAFRMYMLLMEKLNDVQMEIYSVTSQRGAFSHTPNVLIHSLSRSISLFLPLSHPSSIPFCMWKLKLLGLVSSKNDYS